MSRVGRISTVDFDFPAIYPITDRNISGLTILEQVRRLIAGGATLIQIREKSANVRDFLDDAAEAVRHAHECGARVIVNDRVDLAMVLKADGVHLGQEDLPVPEARRLLGPGPIIGLSTHTLAQARLAHGLPIDYLAFGPVFPTATKEAPDPVVGVDSLSGIVSASVSLPVVAIGGITESNLVSVLEAGASSAAVISGVLCSRDGIARAMERLIDLSRRINNTVASG